jgi:hypothetical protein
VRDAGVRVDDLRRAVRDLRVDLGGDEHRAVAERARVEDRRDLADDAAVEQALHAPHDLALLEPGQPGDVGERAPYERELPLHQVQELLVGVVERDGGPITAAAGLHRSHVATSLAW